MAFSSPSFSWSSGRWVAGASSLVLGLGLVTPPEAWAARTLTLALETAPAKLQLTQVRLRVGVRPVRYRVSQFLVGGTCLREAELLPVTPEVTDDEATEAGLILDVDYLAGVDSTAQSHPAFFIYVPPLAAPTTAQFSLQTDPSDVSAAAELVWGRFPITHQGGIVGIYLPETIAGLEVNHHYYWQMMVECDRGPGGPNPVAGGWVYRVESTLAGSNSETASVTTRVTRYVEAGLWQDALTLLATERYKNPSDRDLTRLWQDLMVAAGLEAIAPEPLAQRVNLTHTAITQPTP
ncbi:DUF928 domain-containing protein [Leptolyngbya sp. PCC 6406]|uniref:DUF928 domain-containing protein n=1 Tax=Leptolyngbya sp. PCC 6406 TaxID=1173264 RepID=UPI0002AC6FD3|nr:DUF928 domain-containing protein [Leptolyngbya sp. PCC 6406]